MAGGGAVKEEALEYFHFLVHLDFPKWVDKLLESSVSLSSLMWVKMRVSTVQSSWVFFPFFFPLVQLDLYFSEWINWWVNCYALGMKSKNNGEFEFNRGAILFQSSLIVGVLLLVLTDVLAVQKHKGCMHENELMNQAKKFLRRAGRYTEHKAARAESTPSCSDFTHWTYSGEQKNRSLSPWRSRWVPFLNLRLNMNNISHRCTELLYYLIKDTQQGMLHFHIFFLSELEFSCLCIMVWFKLGFLFWFVFFLFFLFLSFTHFARSLTKYTEKQENFGRDEGVCVCEHAHSWASFIGWKSGAGLKVNKPSPSVWRNHYSTTKSAGVAHLYTSPPKSSRLCHVLSKSYPVLWL